MGQPVDDGVEDVAFLDQILNAEDQACDQPVGRMLSAPFKKS
jgi:hypothetical protein